MPPLELTRSGILASIAVFIVVAVCIRLGVWQLDRLEERRTRNAVVAERLEETPLELDRWPADTAGLTYRRARLTGRFDHDGTLVLAGRSHQGAPGAHVLSPLRLADGGVLVNRGWMPAADGATVDLERVRLPGDAAVGGVLMPFPDIDLDMPSDPAFRRTWYRFHGDAMRAQSPYPLASLYLQATSSPAVADADSARGRPVILPAPSLDEGPHLSYAVQWFSFAAIFLIGWVALLLRRGQPAPGEAPGARPSPG